MKCPHCHREIPHITPRQADVLRQVALGKAEGQPLLETSGSGAR